MNKNSADVKGCSMYVALFPCNECAKLIIQAGRKWASPGFVPSASEPARSSAAPCVQAGLIFPLSLFRSKLIALSTLQGISRVLRLRGARYSET